MDGRTMLLDTHAVVFLHAGRLEEFSELGKRLLEQEQVYLGPMAALELQYLYEIERIRYPAQRIMDDLYLEIGLRILERDWMSVIRKSWDLDLDQRSLRQTYRCPSSHRGSEAVDP
jgi:PIN domain nuclease of toxin-antitoxin system